MNLKRYIQEEIDKDKMHDKLRIRYLKSSDKLTKARKYIMDAKDDFEKIKKIMKRHNIKTIVNDKGYEIFNSNDEINIWDMMA